MTELTNGKGDRTVNANVNRLVKDGMSRTSAIRYAVEHAGKDADFTHDNVKERQANDERRRNHSKR
jgi:hypothetical protein